MFEIGADKGIKGSIQAAARFPFVVRSLIPGALAAILVLPFLPWDIELAKLSSLEESLPIWAGMLLLLFLLGWIISRLEDPIYRAFEGRAYWPRGLREKAIGLHQQHVKTLLEHAKTAKAKGERLRYNEIWVRLRMYPISPSDGDPYASHPTLLGNILAAYEDYPLTRYGMDSIFYWPRLWLSLDREKKQEIDQEWSVADGLTSMAAVCYMGGALYVVTALVSGLASLAGFNGTSWLGIRLPFASTAHTALASGASLMLGYVFYRISIPFHLRNGEVFKSIFDLYRERLNPLISIGPDEKEKWEAVWGYLQYRRVKCIVCDTWFNADKEECPTCELPTTRILQKLEREKNSNASVEVNEPKDRKLP